MTRTHEETPLSWRQYKETAFGVLGLHPWEFYEYTIEEFIYRIRGNQARNIDEWRQTRLILFGLYGLGGGKAKKPENIMPLPGDRKTTGGSVRNMSDEEKKQWRDLKRRQVQEHLDRKQTKQ